MLADWGMEIRGLPVRSFRCICSQADKGDMRAVVSDSDRDVNATTKGQKVVAAIEVLCLHGCAGMLLKDRSRLIVFCVCTVIHDVCVEPIPLVTVLDFRKLLAKARKPILFLMSQSKVPT